MTYNENLFAENLCTNRLTDEPLKGQLLKWVGNKQKFSEEIISYFPKNINRYIEPFLGSGATLSTYSPNVGIGSDTYKPLIDLFNEVKNNPNNVIQWYRERINQLTEENKKEVYERIRLEFNQKHNAADLLFISRVCYGGIIRFRKSDGYLSTPIGIHKPMNIDSFEKIVHRWSSRIKNTEFIHSDYKQIMENAQKGDLVYCDPPYTHSQSILYGAQSFDLTELLESIEECKKRGVFVVLSIDGSKKSDEYICDLPIPKGLFEKELFVNVGKSMLRRFQMNGQTLEKENVKDRLLLTF